MKPLYGFTKLDLPVHAAVTDYHKAGGHDTRRSTRKCG